MYENVKNCWGTDVRADALTDEKEYFANLTEAFFWFND
jgi:hypothetical protein